MLNITKEELIADLNSALKVLKEVIHYHFVESNSHTVEYGLCYSMYWERRHPVDVAKYIIPFLYRVTYYVNNASVELNVDNIPNWLSRECSAYFYNLNLDGFNKRVILLEKAIEYISADKKLLLNGYITIIDTPVS